MQLPLKRPVAFVLLTCLMGLVLSGQFRESLTIAHVSLETVDTGQDALEKESKETQRMEDAVLREQQQEKWKNILVYTCFGLSLIMLLWMRKKSKEKQTAQE